MFEILGHLPCMQHTVILLIEKTSQNYPYFPADLAL